MITDGAVDTAGAKHAAAVLLAHLRAIKQASGHGANHELNQAGDYADDAVVPADLRDEAFS